MPYKAEIADVAICWHLQCELRFGRKNDLEEALALDIIPDKDPVVRTNQKGERLWAMRKTWRRSKFKRCSYIGKAVDFIEQKTTDDQTFDTNCNAHSYPQANLLTPQE